MSEPTKEAIEEASTHLEVLAPYIDENGDAMMRVDDFGAYVRWTEHRAAINHVRKKARDDALETVKRCEQKSGNCVMVHSLMRHDVCNEENCSSFRALKDQPSGEA